MTFQNITSKTWVEKYRPKYFSDVKGQDLAIEKIKLCISNSKKKAILLYGSPGTGKTTLAYVLSNELNSEIFELNASDLRNRDKLESILKPAIQQKSLVKTNKIILVDEVDGISGVDRGGLQELLELISKSSYLIILTGNDIWDKKFSSLRSKCELIQLKEVEYKTIKDILIFILRKEQKFIENDILTSISIKAKGDIRAAINDIQSLSEIKEITPEMIDERNKEIDIFQVLRIIFKNSPKEEILNLFDSTNMSLDDILLWIEENIPSEYHGEELAKAYEYLSQADLFRGRIYKQQYWRFLAYQNFFLSYGVSSAKFERKTGFTSYKKPSRILKMWMHNQKIEKKKSISKKYAKYVHIGEKRALKEFSILKSILQNSKIQKELKLSEEEIEYLKN